MPVIPYLDKADVVVKFDLSGAERRTKVVTVFFNIVLGDIDGKVFVDFPC